MNSNTKCSGITINLCLRCGNVLKEKSFAGMCSECNDEIGISALYENTSSRIMEKIRNDKKSRKWFMDTIKNNPVSK